MSKVIGIYKIISPSGKVYIGQSVDIKSRFSTYKNIRECVKRQTGLYNSLIKYGSENHTFEIIEECIVEELSNREGYWQDFYDSVNNGLNCRRVTTSDKTGYDSEETIEKRRKSNLGKKVSDETKQKQREAKLNKSLSEEHKQSISKSLIGVNKGRVLSEENRLRNIKNLRKSVYKKGIESPNYGKKQSEETVEKRRKALIGKKAKKVAQYTKDGEFIKEFCSISEATSQTKIHNIGAVLRNTRDLAGGYDWRYVENLTNK